jgi:hypothetical protein
VISSQSLESLSLVITSVYWILVKLLHWCVFFADGLGWCLIDYQDLAQPVIAENMTLYPEIEPDHVSEVWEALRWREFDYTQLNPMWTGDGLKRFYINEIAQLVDGALVMPLMWITRKGIVHAECVDVTITPVGLFRCS